jgi:hypothetical protein
MTTDSKNAGDASSFEVDAQDVQVQTQINNRTIGKVDGARISLTVLALLMGITILGVSADALNVYHNTHLSEDFLLPLWPDNFNLQPTIALVVGSTIVTVANIVSLVFSKVRVVSRLPVRHQKLTSANACAQLRNSAAVHTPTAFAAPFIGLAAAIIAMAYFYAINASNDDDTLLSWSCRWTDVGMNQAPYFGTLCRQSWAGVYLSVLLIPVEALVLGTAGWMLKLEKQSAAAAAARPRKAIS